MGSLLTKLLPYSSRLHTEFPKRPSFPIFLFFFFFTYLSLYLFQSLSPFCFPLFLFMAQCPVDHSALGSSSSASSSSYPSASSSATTAGGSTSGDRCPVDHGSFVHSATSESGGAGADKCPVEHGARSTWGGLLGPSSSSSASSSASASASASSSSSTSLLGHLPTAREISSIPRADGEKWVYPSEAQFFAAMERKQHNPRAQDMRVVVPIHNAVNERAWGEVLNLERGWGGDKCGGVKLVSFKGRPKDRTPKAWLKTLLG